MNNQQNDQKQRKPNENTIPEIDADDETDSPQMDEGSEGAEGDSAPSVRRGALNTQYGTDSSRSRGATAPKTVQGSTDEAPDMKGEQSTGGDRDTLSVGRK